MIPHKPVKIKHPSPIRLTHSSRRKRAFGLIFWISDYRRTADVVVMLYAVLSFDTFAQELDTVSKGNQGTGLGLPISRRLAMLMGGDLTFVSRRWEGSSFTFTFIAEPAELPENEYGPAPSDDLKHQNTKILVAEDNELNGEIILELLQSVGFEAELAENGKIALQMFIDSEPDTYDIILMDLLMPEMDGFETAKAIRDLDRPDAKTVRIFACTANSFSENRDKALASGMDDFIEKPVDVRELLKKINE